MEGFAAGSKPAGNGPRRMSDLGIAGALELLEEDLVPARVGVDERGGDDGERAALLDVARGAHEALGLVQRVRVDAAGRCGHIDGGGLQPEQAFSRSVAGEMNRSL